MFVREISRFLALVLMVAFAATPAFAAGKTHRIAIQVDSNDTATMNQALNNIVNIAEYYSSVGDLYEIELVAYGPGLHMLRTDTSPVKDRLRSIKQSIPEVTFSACENTKAKMEKAEGKKITIVPEAHLVPAGVVRLAELQEAGWSYIKP